MTQVQQTLRNVSDNLLTVQGVVFVLGKLCLIASVAFVFYAGEAIKKSQSITIPNFTPPDTQGQSQSQEKVPKSVYEVITNKNIFGKEEVQAPVAAAEPTTLKLRLVGTSVGGSSLPFAIIEETGKQEQDIFDLNEVVFDQAKLIEVLDESVKIEHNGKIEVLYLEDDSESSSADGETEESVTQEGTQFVVDEQELTDALANLPRLLSQARAVPYFRNGQSVGMRLFAIRRGSLYEKLGFQNGDVLKSVNDVSLSDPSQALRIFEQLKNERSIGVVIERSGEDVDLQYSIR